jgi:uncharacterized lipoprotein
MLKIIRPVLLLMIAALSMTACSLFKDKPPEYVDSEEGAPLKVPEDLDAVRPVRPIMISVGEMRMPAGDELNPGPPRAAVTAGGGEANAYLAWSAAGVYLKVDDTPDSVTRRLGIAIERTGMNVLELGDQGQHRFEYAHTLPDDRGFFERILFWRNDELPNYSGTYETRLEADGEETRVYLMFDAGGAANTRAAEHILGIFMERLG